MKKSSSKKINDKKESVEVIKKNASIEGAEKKSSAAPVPEKDVLQELIEKNIKWSQVIYNQNKKINRRLTMMVIGSYVRLALIMAPIIIGILYLPPLLAQMMEQYQSVLGGSASTAFDMKDFFDLWRNTR